MADIPEIPNNPQRPTAAGGVSPDYAGPVVPTFPRPWAKSEIMCWLAIVVLVAFGVIHAVAEQAAPAVQESAVDLSLLITSRMTVGAHSLLKTLPTSIEPLLKQLDAAAKTPRDKFRVAIVHGEIESPEAALERADALAEQFPDLLDDAATLHTLYETHEKPGATQWQKFRERHAWFADLALATSKPPGDPTRDPLINATIIALLVLEGTALAGVATTLVGLLLLIFAIVFLIKGKLTVAFPRAENLPRDRRPYLQGFTLYLAGMLLLGIILREVYDLPLLMIAIIELPSAFVMGLFWPLVVGQRWGAWRAALGLHGGTGFFREMFCGIVGYFAGVPIMALGVAISLLLARISNTTASHPINDVLQRGPAWIALAFVLASIWAPITEELMFRGALFAALRERFSWWLTAPIVAIIFAMIHPQGWVAFPVLTAVALVLAGIREWRGSIVGCITAHAMHNTMALILILLLLG